MTSRRAFIGLTATTMAAIAGCTGPGTEQEDPPEDNNNETNPDNDNIDINNFEPADQQELTNWEGETNCESDQPDSMVNSEIHIVSVQDSIGSEYTPVEYESLPNNQKEIVALVLTQGGYITCDESDAFQEFFQNAVRTGYDQEADVSTIYLEYDNTYYHLYLRRQDQVFSY